MMKRILIAGAGSYIGTSFEKWLKKFPDDYCTYTLDMKNHFWKEEDFSKYEVVLYAAGIVHIKETEENRALFYNVNRDLSYEIAKKAKNDGIRQFIFLSTMSVYGIENGIITENSYLNPKSDYGKSKLQAEELIKNLEDNSFRVAIIRPPMVYGKGCRGNYQRLSKMAVKVPLFPKTDNKRSMIYIDNLCEFIKQLIDNYERGLFFPQNKEYVNSSEMVKFIAEAHGRKIWMIKLFNPLLRQLNIKIINKVFDDLIYEMNMSEYKSEYRVCGFKNSVLKSEGIKKE